MNSFTWRGMTWKSDGAKRLFRVGEGLQAELFYDFPSEIKHAHAFDQNLIVVLLADGSLWQCGAVEKGPLILAAAANQIVFMGVRSVVETRADDLRPGDHRPEARIRQDVQRG